MSQNESDDHVEPLKWLLKVSKFQKQIFLFSFPPKNERNYFLISVLASKMGQIKKMMALYDIRGI